MEAALRTITQPEGIEYAQSSSLRYERQQMCQNVHSASFIKLHVQSLYTIIIDIRV